MAFLLEELMAFFNIARGRHSGQELFNKRLLFFHFGAANLVDHEAHLVRRLTGAALNCDCIGDWRRPIR